MKHTKDQIIEIAKTIMKEIKWSYDDSSAPVAVFESVEDQCEGKEGFDRFEEYKKMLYPKWTVTFAFEQEYGEQFMYLDINDNTGEPTRAGHKQGIFKVVKKSSGIWEIDRYF